MNMILGERIRELRNQKGWSQKELTIKLQLRSQGTVSSWETNVSEPNPTQRKNLCKVFEISEAELFGGITSKISPEILAALEDSIAVKALLVTSKHPQEIKNAIKCLLDCLPNLSIEKRKAIVALCK